MPHVLRTTGFNTPQRIFLAVPTYGPLPAEFVHSLWGAQLALGVAGIGATLEILTENCHVDDGRNLLVRDFLETDCTDLVFLDTDVLFAAENIVQLVISDADVVAGVYPLKQDPQEFPVRLLPGELRADDNGLVEVEGVPTGFLRIRRSVLEELEKDANKFLGRKESRERRSVPIIFERTFKGNLRIGGDYTFCEKWRETGGKIHVIPDMKFGHVGTRIWSGSVGAFWKREHGVYETDFEAAIEAVRAGTDTEEDHQALANHWGNIPWAAGWGLLGRWIDVARKADGDILEVGAGLTSVMAAIANPDQKVYALEHDFLWAAKIQAYADKYGVENLEVVTCPLKDGWYDMPQDFPVKFSAVLVDGPPRNLGNRNMFTVAGFDLDGATVIWDDIDQLTMQVLLDEFCTTNGMTSEIIEHVSKPFAIAA